MSLTKVLHSIKVKLSACVLPNEGKKNIPIKVYRSNNQPPLMCHRAPPPPPSISRSNTQSSITASLTPSSSSPTSSQNTHLSLQLDHCTDTIGGLPETREFLSYIKQQYNQEAHDAVQSKFPKAAAETLWTRREIKRVLEFLMSEYKAQPTPKFSSVHKGLAPRPPISNPNPRLVSLAENLTSVNPYSESSKESPNKATNTPISGNKGATQLPNSRGKRIEQLRTLATNRIILDKLSAQYQLRNGLRTIADLGQAIKEKYGEVDFNELKEKYFAKQGYLVPEQFIEIGNALLDNLVSKSETPDDDPGGALRSYVFAKTIQQEKISFDFDPNDTSSFIGDDDDSSSIKN